MAIIDRRLNPGGKSLGNRKRFLKRAREHLKSAVDKMIDEGSLKEGGKGGSVSIPHGGIAEPQLHRSDSGIKRRILTGNKEFATGDRLPRQKGGGGRSGSKASKDGEGEDAFRFALTKEEFLDIFFEDLELPDMVKRELQGIEHEGRRHAGYTTSGSPANMAILRTTKRALMRRISLNRPTQADIEELERRLEQCTDEQEKSFLAEKLALARTRTQRIPFIDTSDVRYRRFEPVPIPVAQAVMFCLMDVSASMDEEHKSLAKRFFLLLHLFLERRYERVEVVFIRHTHVAEEVDEQTFFYGRGTGGTVVSSALKTMLDTIAKRYPLALWNIYAAQASDGDNIPSDVPSCVEILRTGLLPSCQYFAYLEIMSRDSDLWQGYRSIDEPNFAMSSVKAPKDIYPVFRKLFAKNQSERSP